jgi:hypothetical protein
VSEGSLCLRCSSPLAKRPTRPHRPTCHAAGGRISASAAVLSFEDKRFHLLAVHFSAAWSSAAEVVPAEVVPAEVVPAEVVPLGLVPLGLVPLGLVPA